MKLFIDARDFTSRFLGHRALPNAHVGVKYVVVISSSAMWCTAIREKERERILFTKAKNKIKILNNNQPQWQADRKGKCPLTWLPLT